MAMKLNTRYLKSFVNEHELKAIEPQVLAAHRTLTEKSGLGNDYLGWTTLPKDYDREEFSRIKAAAGKIQSIPTCCSSSASAAPTSARAPRSSCCALPITTT